MHEICGILIYKHVHNHSIIPCATTPHTFGRDLNKAKDSYLNEPFELIIPLSSSFVGLNRSQTTTSSGWCFYNGCGEESWNLGRLSRSISFHGISLLDDALDTWKIETRVYSSLSDSGVIVGPPHPSPVWGVRVCVCVHASMWLWECMCIWFYGAVQTQIRKE